MKFGDVVELFKNKRYRAILILIIYVIFFIILASMFRNTSSIPSSPIKEKTPIEKYCELGNYEYRANYQIASKEFSIEGKTFRTDSYFKLDDNEYYLKDSVSYQIVDDEFYEVQLDFDYFDIKTICSLFNNGSLISKSEDYQNESIIDKYSVYNEVLDRQIYVSSNIKDEIIDKVIIDLSSNENKYVIEIDYKNIGKVINFTSIFDEEKIKKGVEE